MADNAPNRTDSASPLQGYQPIAHAEVEEARQEALRLRAEANDAWGRYVSLAGERQNQLENWPTTCPAGCGVTLPAWADRAKWEHMDTVHSDRYDPAIIGGGYDISWERVPELPPSNGRPTDG